MAKKCYIIAGPNGAGKTTFATEFLPIEAECLNFIKFISIWLISGLFLIHPGKYPESWKSQGMIMKKHNKYSILGLKALQRAAAKVAEDA